MNTLLPKVLTVLKLVLYAGVTCAAVFHGAMTLLYNLPSNPIKTLTNLHNAYIGQFFYQDWGLFAPTPVDMDINLLLDCRSKDGTSSGPLEVTAELVRRHQQNRFTPYERLSRVPDNYAHTFVSMDRDEVIFAKECANDPKGDGCRKNKQARERREASARRGLTRVANAFCGDMSAYRYGNKPFDRATAWIGISKIPRWSKRFTERKEMKLFEVGTLMLAQPIAYGIWR